MKTKLNFRSVVFKRAYKIAKQSGCNFSQALRLAWSRFRDYKNKMVDELVSKINGFDFYYSRSDDNRVYRYWSNIESQICEQLSFNSCFIGTISKRLTDNKSISRFI
jgi:hypothetical protein